MHSLNRLFGVATLALAVAVPAHAALKVNGEHSGNFTFAQGAVAAVPLNSANATSLTFSGSGKHVITYTAECAVSAAAGNASTWLNIDILVDGVPVGQSAGTPDAFCTANGTSGADGWTMAAMQVVTPALGTGAHTVQINAAVENGVAGNSGWLGDSSITVVK